MYKQVAEFLRIPPGPQYLVVERDREPGSGFQWPSDVHDDYRLFDEAQFLRPCAKVNRINSEIVFYR